MRKLDVETQLKQKQSNPLKCNLKVNLVYYKNYLFSQCPFISVTMNWKSNKIYVKINVYALVKFICLCFCKNSQNTPFTDPFQVIMNSVKKFYYQFSSFEIKGEQLSDVEDSKTSFYKGTLPLWLAAVQSKRPHQYGWSSRNIIC